MFHLARVSSTAELIPFSRTIDNAKKRSESAESLIYSSLGRILWKVMSNENDAANKSLLYDQKHRRINVHYLREFW